MATGVEPREEPQFTRSDLEALEDAMKNKKFRELLVEYAEEVTDPANHALYQKEMTQLEKERGYDITFINPKGGYVIKTSVAGDRKAFINICSSETVAKPSYKVEESDGRRGMNWSIPYSLIPPREDYDKKREKCVIYDVVYHPDTLRMAEVNKRFRELVNNTALDALKKTYNINLDCNNFRFPKSLYKGMTTPAVIRKEDPDYKPPNDDDEENIDPELMDKLYPQKVYPNSTKECKKVQENKNTAKVKFEELKSENGYTIPKYIMKQQKNVDLQDYTFDRNNKQYSAIPSHLVIHINLPLLSSTSDCLLDVQEKELRLISEKPARYKLNVTLPYSVCDESGDAKFDKTKRVLTVTLPVIRKNNTNELNRTDSGLESEEYCGSHSDEEIVKESLINEIDSNELEMSAAIPDKPQEIFSKADVFMEPTLSYILPSYTHNVLEDTIAFTFHVKNTEPDSVVVRNTGNKVQIKFTSVGSGFVPAYYAAVIIFEDNVEFDNVTGEAWDNNVILQLELNGKVPQKYGIGLSEESEMIYKFFDASISEKTKAESEQVDNDKTVPVPVVEVTNLGNETSIVVSSSNMTECNEDELADYSKEKEIVWTEDYSSNAKSILRKSMARSLSESSVGDVASSMDYISSDCIPEESSLKKTVRFNDVIAKQFYRYNSSIEGQKKKNQRKKSKKRTQERLKSESEAEEDSTDSVKTSKTKPKSAMKERHDSGLADTSDADTENKNTLVTSSENYKDKPNQSLNNLAGTDSAHKVMVKTDHEKSNSQKFTCDTIKHNTDLYNPDKLNKGQYVEIQFKNDLIFDLDM